MAMEGSTPGRTPRVREAGLGWSPSVGGRPGGGSPSAPGADRDRSVLRTILMALYGLSAVVIVVAALLPHDPHEAIQWGVAAVNLAVVALLTRGAPSDRLLRALVLGGTIPITAIVVADGTPGGTPFFYLWPALLAAYYFGTAFVVATCVASAAMLAFALATSAGVPDAAIIELDMVAAVGGCAFVVARLRRRGEALLARLHEASTRDPLTGLLNRGSITDTLGREVARARRTGRPLSIALIDVDHFKAINDGHGHLVGDETLRRVAEHLAAAVRAGDIVGRMGGEEFAVLFPETGEDAALAVMERLRGDLALHLAEHGPSVTVSAGVATSASGEDGLELLGRADLALYRAKDAGRDRVMGASRAPR